MPTHDFTNIGDVLNFDILRGTITSIDAETDTCEVTVGGQSVTALLFYHCEPDSVLRDNGAIEGAAAGFAEDDEVIVMVSKVDDTVKVIAHVDGVRHCAMYAVFIITSGTTKQVVVWDVKKDEPLSIPRETPLDPLEMPCDFDDPDFQSWYLARKEDETEDLFESKILWWHTFATELNWQAGTYVVETDFGTFTDYLTQEGQTRTGLIHVYGDPYEDSYYTTKVFRYPVSFSAKAGEEVFGTRWADNYTGIPQNFNNHFIGYTHFENELDLNGRYIITYGPTGAAHYYYTNTMSLDYNSDGYRFEPVLQGVKSDKCIANVMLNYYTPCTIDTDYSFLTWYNITVEPGETVIQVCSQALYYPDGYEGEEILPEGDNSALSELIAEGVQAISDLVGKNQYIGITVSIMK